MSHVALMFTLTVAVPLTMHIVFPVSVDAAPPSMIVMKSQENAKGPLTVNIHLLTPSATQDAQMVLMGESVLLTVDCFVLMGPVTPSMESVSSRSVQRGGAARNVMWIPV